MESKINSDQSLKIIYIVLFLLVSGVKKGSAQVFNIPEIVENKFLTLHNKCIQRSSGTVNDLTRMHLKGPIKSLERFVYPAQTKDGTVVKKDLSYRLHIFFNEIGNISRQRIASSDQTNKETYTYNTQDQLTEHKVYNNHMDVVTKEVYVYNKTHQLMKQTGYTGTEGKLHKEIIFLFDEKALIASYTSINFEDSTDMDGKTKYTYSFGDRGCVTSLKRYSQGRMNKKETFRYDKGSLVEQHIYTANIYAPDHSAKLQRRLIYSYNKHGDEILVKTFSPQDELQSTNRNTYDSDEHGNWIKKTMIKYEVPEYIIERVITYYK